MLHLLNDSATVIIAAVTLSFTFLFIYNSEGQRYLLFWSIGWGINAVSVIFRTLPMAAPGIDYFILISLILSYASSIFIGLGVYHFVYGKLPTIRAVFLMIPLTLAPGFLHIYDPYEAFTAITYTFAGVVFMVSGAMLIRKIRGIGSKVTGTAFITWSLVTFNIIFINSDIETAYNSMQIIVFITLVTAIGIVIMHFEKMRSELDSTNLILKQITDNNKDFVFSLKLKPTPYIEHISRSVLNMTGYTPEELIGNTELLGKMMQQEGMDALRLAGEGVKVEQPFTDTISVETKYESIITLDINRTVIYGMDGKPESIIGIARDITKKTQEMDRILSEKTWYEQIFKCSNIMTMLVDRETMKIMDSNDALCNFYFYRHSRMMNMDVKNLFVNEKDYSDFIHYSEQELPFQCINLLPDGSQVYVTMHASALKFDGNNYMYVTILDNTSENYLAFELSTMKNLHGSILESLNEGVIGIDRDGNIFFINNSAAEKLGYTQEELLYKNHHSTIHCSDKDCSCSEAECSILDCLHGGGQIRDRKDFFINKNGSSVPVIYNFSTLLNSRSANMGVLVFRDITEEVKAEEMILASLEENKTLLKELHHRVKNNFQMICSLLSLHADELEESDEKDFLNECVLKILSMSLTHELLFETNSFSLLGSKQYFERMLSNLIRASENMEDIKLTTDIKDINLTLDEAVPCALIINELFTNAVKYARTDREKLEIVIEFDMVDGEKILIFSDNGKGLDSVEDFGKTSSYGLLIIKSLTRQLKGALNFENKNGLCVTLRYK